MSMETVGCLFVVSGVSFVIRLYKYSIASSCLQAVAVREQDGRSVCALPALCSIGEQKEHQCSLSAIISRKCYGDVIQTVLWDHGWAFGWTVALLTTSLWSKYRLTSCHVLSWALVMWWFCYQRTHILYSCADFCSSFGLGIRFAMYPHVVTRLL